MPYPIVHFEIHVNDFERAMTFYREVLGWAFKTYEELDYTVVFPWGEVTEGPAAVGINGGLVLRADPNASGHPGEPNAFVCTVSVDDLDDVLARVEAYGGEIHMDATPMPGVGTIAYVRDNDANLFGLLQPEMTSTD